MHPTPLESSNIRDGFALGLNGLYWPRPYFPTLQQRADLIAEHLPSWAIPTAHTAGWIWTGMGSPLPFAVLRPARPALSPIEREKWGAREFREHHHQRATLGYRTLTSQRSTVTEILTHGVGLDSCATQLVFLDPAAAMLGSSPVKMSPTQLVRAGAMRARVGLLRRCYPDITR